MDQTTIIPTTSDKFTLAWYEEVARQAGRLPDLDTPGVPGTLAGIAEEADQVAAFCLNIAAGPASSLPWIPVGTMIRCYEITKHVAATARAMDVGDEYIDRDVGLNDPPDPTAEKLRDIARQMHNVQALAYRLNCIADAIDLVR